MKKKRSEVERVGKVTGNVTLRSAVERVARRMRASYIADAACLPKVGADHLGPWHALAKWHLRELRKARGRTVGHVRLSRESDESGEDCWYEINGLLLDEPNDVRMLHDHDEVARVVLVPRRKGGAR